MGLLETAKCRQIIEEVFIRKPSLTLLYATGTTCTVGLHFSELHQGKPANTASSSNISQNLKLGNLTLHIKK